MAYTVYSTHYTAPGNIWADRVAGLFQVKDDEYIDGPGCWEDSSNCAFAPTWEYQTNNFWFGPVDIIDYEEARHWPHP